MEQGGIATTLCRSCVVSRARAAPLHGGMVSRIAATVVTALAFAPAAQAQEFADWTSLTNGNTVLSGTLLGAPVHG